MRHNKHLSGCKQTFRAGQFWCEHVSLTSRHQLCYTSHFRLKSQDHLMTVIQQTIFWKTLCDILSEKDIVSVFMALGTHFIRQEFLAGFSYSPDGIIHISLPRQAVYRAVQCLRHSFSYLKTHTHTHTFQSSAEHLRCFSSYANHRHTTGNFLFKIMSTSTYRRPNLPSAINREVLLLYINPLYWAFLIKYSSWSLV